MYDSVEVWTAYGFVWNIVRGVDSPYSYFLTNVIIEILLPEKWKFSFIWNFLYLNDFIMFKVLLNVLIVINFWC